MVLSPDYAPQGRAVVRLHDQAAFTVRAERPTPLQVDGEALGDYQEVRFESVPRGLTVIV